MRALALLVLCLAEAAAATPSRGTLFKVGGKTMWIGPDPPHPDFDVHDGLDLARRTALGLTGAEETTGLSVRQPPSAGPARLFEVQWANTTSPADLRFAFQVDGRHDLPDNRYVSVRVVQRAPNEPLKSEAQIWEYPRDLPFGKYIFDRDYREVPAKIVSITAVLASLRRSTALPAPLRTWRQSTATLSYQLTLLGKPLGPQAGPFWDVYVGSDDQTELRTMLMSTRGVEVSKARYRVDALTGEYLGMTAYTDGAVWVRRPAIPAVPSTGSPRAKARGHLARGIAWVAALRGAPRQPAFSSESEFAQAVRLDSDWGLAHALLGMELARACGGRDADRCRRGLAELAEATRLEPRLALAWYLLASAEQLGGRLEPRASVALCDRALDLAPRWDTHALNICADVDVTWDREKVRATLARARGVPSMRPTELLARYLAAESAAAAVNR